MSADYLNALLLKYAKYRRKGLLVDTNLLLLYLVGLAKPEGIASFKPTANHGFSIEEFQLLSGIISHFQKLVTTPHILTEVSNHSSKLKGDNKHRFCEIIRSLVESWEERHPRSADLCKSDEFQRLGLTDTAISEISPGNYLVITVDFELAGLLQKKGVDVLNFNQLRPSVWSNPP